MGFKNSSDKAPKHAKTVEPQQPQRVDETTGFDPVQKPDVHNAIADAASDAPAYDAAAYDISAYDASAYTSKSGKRHKALKVTGIVLGAIVGAMAIAYFAGVIVFSGHFWPKATIGNSDISMKTPDELTQLLDKNVNNYTLHVKGDGVDVSLNSSEAGVKFDAASVASTIFSHVDAWKWPLEVFSDHDETASLAATLDEEGMSDKLKTAVDEINANASAPQNAYVAYDEGTKQFKIFDEVYGTQINYDAVMKSVATSVATLQDNLTLGEDELTQPEVFSDDPRLASALAQANALTQVNLQLTMAGQTATTVDAATVAPWITVNDDYTVTLDDSKLSAWADEVVSNWSTVGTTRTYTRPDGGSFTVSGGYYGWQVSHDELVNTVKTAIETQQTGTTDMPCSQTGAVYNGVGGRDWGSRYIDIDLSEQHAYLYDSDGNLLWDSAIVSGKPRNGSGSLTPTGVYVINSNDGGTTLKGSNDDGSKYETKVTYWMPFVGNLIGLHDANWQSAFGGSRYRNGYGSHGCVNLPVSAAANLSSLISAGDVVVCHW